MVKPENIVIFERKEPPAAPPQGIIGELTEIPQRM